MQAFHKSDLLDILLSGRDNDLSQNRKWRPSQHAEIPSMQYPEFGNLKYPQRIMACRSGHERNPSRLFFWSCGRMRRIQNHPKSNLWISFWLQIQGPISKNHWGSRALLNPGIARVQWHTRKNVHLGMSVNPWLSKLRSHIFSWMGWWMSNQHTETSVTNHCLIDLACSIRVTEWCNTTVRTGMQLDSKALVQFGLWWCLFCDHTCKLEKPHFWPQTSYIQGTFPLLQPSPKWNLFKCACITNSLGPISH